MSQPGALEAHLRSRRHSGRKLLVPYVTAGLGDHWLEVIEAMAAAGADAVEVGIPFSDPVMDGPTIQEASQRALDGGATPLGLLGQLEGVDVDIPLVAMTYYNLVFRTGHRRFARSLAASGVSGAVVPDLPLEELEDWARAAEDAAVATVLLASPVTPDDRLVRICERTRGFVYGVSVMGITGERQSLAESAAIMAKRLKAVTDKPVLIGFGVSTPSHAVEAAAEADGVIVASALMRRLLDGASPEDLGAFVADLRAALDAEVVGDGSA
ncbi:MAG: tryptophan synthase subunit alpha [Actinomycetota bacterium]|nr:tryptophan synthase subunit alpha [Actinomycetota bacterium]MDQ3643103.1 tryptophan synthase subunit alpha [Actinomycetota bacterium]